MNVNTIFRNINKRTVTNQNKPMTCTTCDYPVSDEWIADKLSDEEFTIYYKHTTTGTNTSGEKVTITKYLTHQQFDGQCPAYIELAGYCRGYSYEEGDDGEEVECDCDENITVKLIIAGAIVE